MTNSPPARPPRPVGASLRPLAAILPILAAVLPALFLAIGSGCRRTPTGNPPRPSITNRVSNDSAIQFVDIAESAGISYVYPKQPRPMRNLDSIGCGCAAFDYDGDGWMDILLVASPHPILYRNRGNGTFEDVTSKCGLDRLQGEWKGCAIGDVDADGRLDILLLGYRCLVLLKNGPNGQFVDTTRSAGLDPANRNHWGTSAGFMDLDGSGRLSLVILNYVIFGPNEPQYCVMRPGVRSGCPPSTYHEEFPELWRNDGKGRFREITRESGLANERGKWNVHGKALVVAFCDFENNGRIGFYVGNDGTPADLLRNDGRLLFTNVGLEQGVALGVYRQMQAAMGADWADYDRDGRMDLVNTAFSGEPYSLYHNGGGYFDNVSVPAGIAGPTRSPLGFGVKFLDADNDGYPDLIFANGHVYDEAAAIDPATSLRQTLLLFRNQDGKSFENVGPAAGEAFTRPILGRGLVTADFDRDGRIDVLVIDYEGRPLLLHNTSPHVGHWLEINLASAPSNRFAYGARVTLHAGKATWVGDVSPASSYESSSAPILHFGLGAAEHIDGIEVRWSDRTVERFPCGSIDSVLTLKKGTGMTGGEHR